MDLNWGYKGKLLGLFSVLYGLLYVVPNYRPLAPPSFLPMLAIDHAMPFLPWTFLIYISDYPMCLSPILIIWDAERFRSLVRTAYLTLILCGTFFIAFPTIYPRPEYPAVTNPLIQLAMFLVGTLDQPSNCFPSMHVAITACAAWSLRYKGPRWFAAYVVWALAIIVSTLTTKQHYFVDIIGGLAVFLTVAIVEWAYCERQRAVLVLRHVFPSRTTPPDRKRVGNG